MRKKKKTPAEELQELEKELQESHDRWKYIKDNGCSDPFWSDGCNINLVRNHCIYYRRQIKALCETQGLDYPEIYHESVPPEMPMDFMARPRKCLWEQVHSTPKITRPVQLSLF